MPANSKTALEDARKATASAAAETTRAFKDLTNRAQGAIRGRYDDLKGPAREYTDYAGERFDEAQRYVVERINERPVAAAGVALGVGLVLGLLLAGRRR